MIINKIHRVTFKPHIHTIRVQYIDWYVYYMVRYGTAYTAHNALCIFHLVIVVGVLWPIQMKSK